MISCQKFLEAPYDNRAIISSVEDFQSLAIESYPLRQDLFTDILTDDYHHYANLMQASLIPAYIPIFLYQDDYVHAQGTPSQAYADYYAKIYVANYIIEEIVHATGEEQRKNLVLGEALLNRAYAYFSLVNLFGLHYHPQRSSQDLGVPLVLEVPTENRPLYDRNTVQEVYNQVQLDAQRGLALLLETRNIAYVNPYRFTVASAYALLSRIALYSEDWDQAVEWSSLCFAENGINIRNLNNDLTLLRTTSLANFALEFMNPSTHSNILLATQTNAFLTRPTGFRLAGFYPAHSLYYSFPRADLRFQLFSSGGTVIDSVTNIVKYAQQPNQPNVGNARYENFTIEEVLLNRAEANLRRSSPNREQAISDLELLRAQRLTNYVPLNTANLSDAQLLDAVYEQRRFEFLGQGMRWFDVKRLGIRVEHRIDRRSAQPDVVLEPNDLRTALQIPLNARIGNPNLESQLNPR